MEVMISTAIMAFVLVSTMTIIGRTSQYVTDLRSQAQSSQILQQRLEELRSMNWDQITNLPSAFTSSIDTNGTYGKTLSASNYQYFGTTVTVMRITATVTWTNRQNVVVTNNMTTLISNGGLNKATL